MSEENGLDEGAGTPLATPRGPLTAPLTFGRYRLIERIGAGGMAEIWRGLAVGDQGFERTVAIKRIREEVAQVADIGRLFADEARLSALLDHPNIVQVYDFGAVDGDCYIAMEYLHGRNLDQVLLALRRTGEHLPPGLAVFIAREVARGLAHAHSLRDPRGRPYHIVHRDVSPANIMLLQAGAVKLLDFGIARVTSELRLAVTQGRALRGKCPYLAPEQITGGNVDGRSDIFALGVVLWEMLTGQRLFGGDSDLDTIANVLNRNIVRPSALVPDIPPELDRIVLGALARDTDRRYRLADFMAADLDEVTRALPSRHGDLAALITRLFGPSAQERAAEAGARAVAPPHPTAARFAVELASDLRTDAEGSPPLVGPNDVTKALPLVDAAALPAPRTEAAPEGEAVAEDSREVITAPDLGARLTTGRSRRVVGPRGRWAFAVVLGTLLVTELLGALVYRGLVGGSPPAATTGPATSPTAAVGKRCPAPGPAPVPAPAPSQPPPSTRAVRTAAVEARPAKLRGARERKRSSLRPRTTGSWAVGRKNVTRTIKSGTLEGSRAPRERAAAGNPPSPHAIKSGTLEGSRAPRERAAAGNPPSPHAIKSGTLEGSRAPRERAAAGNPPSPHAIARRAPSARATELHVDPFAE
jgi:Protein kinase domain